MTSSEIRELIDGGKLRETCQVLCANHHAIKTFEQKEYKKRNAKAPLFDGPDPMERWAAIDWAAQKRIDALFPQS